MCSASFRVLLLGAAIVSALLADGGTELFRKAAPPFLVIVLADSVPLRTGSNDVSVMVQKSSDQSNVANAVVNVRLRKPGNGTITEIYAPATHARATNKLLYAAKITPTSAGSWELFVDVSMGGATASVSDRVQVLEKAPPTQSKWPFLVIVPVLILLFVFNRWLKSKREAMRQQVRR